MKIDGDILTEFIRESNAIEGIHRKPRQTEVDLHEEFLALSEINVADLVKFVWTIQPGANLRNRLGMNVHIGHFLSPSFVPLPDGPDIQDMLDTLLQRIAMRNISPWEAHATYETLHPFTDGNGRSGRALWLWHSLRDGTFRPGRSFLHHWYYDTLNRHRLPVRA